MNYADPSYIYNNCFYINRFPEVKSILSNCHLLYWSGSYFLSRITINNILHKDGEEYKIVLYGQLSWRQLIKEIKENPMCQLALSFRTAVGHDSIVIVKPSSPNFTGERSEP